MGKQVDNMFCGDSTMDQRESSIRFSDTPFSYMINVGRLNRLNLDCSLDSTLVTNDIYATLENLNSAMYMVFSMSMCSRSFHPGQHSDATFYLPSSPLPSLVPRVSLVI